MISDEITVCWYMRTGELSTEGFEKICERLSGAERGTASRFVFDQDRWAYACTHALLRVKLLEIAGIDDPAFSYGPHGRPELAIASDELPLRFNLTHADGISAVAFSRKIDVGVDAESFSRTTLDGLSLEHLFHSDEISLIKAASPGEHPRVFCQIWTAKEALLKATGLGLNYPLDAFSVSVSPINVRFHIGDRRVAGAWGFHQRQMDEGFITVAFRAESALDLPERCHFVEVSVEELLERC